MKNLGIVGPLFAALLLVASLAGAKQIKELGPHGGRLMQAGKLKVEFHLDKDRKGHVYLYDEKLKPVNADLNQITLKISKGGTKKVELSKAPWTTKDKAEAVHLVSQAPLPSPDGYLMVLSMKLPGKPIDVLRFNFAEEICGECKAPEYACICEH